MATLQHEIEDISGCIREGRRPRPGMSYRVELGDERLNYRSAVTTERVLRLALVQLAGRAAPFLGLLDPVEREQRALHAPDLAKRERQAVRARVAVLVCRTMQ